MQHQNDDLEKKQAERLEAQDDKAKKPNAPIEAIQPIRNPAAEAADERKEALEERKEAVEEVRQEQAESATPPPHPPLAPAENPRAVQADQAEVKPAVRMQQNTDAARAALGMRSHKVEPGELTETEEKALRQAGEAEAEIELRKEAKQEVIDDAKEEAKAGAKDDKKAEEKSE